MSERASDVASCYSVLEFLTYSDLEIAVGPKELLRGGGRSQDLENTEAFSWERP